MRYLLLLLIIILTTPVYAQFYTLDEDQFYDQTSTYDPVQRSIQRENDRYFDQNRRQAEEQSGIIFPDNYPFVWNQIDSKLRMNLDERYLKIRKMNQERMDRIRELNRKYKKELE